MDSWQAHVPSGTDPTSNMARADINGDDYVNLKDLDYVTSSRLSPKTPLTMDINQETICREPRAACASCT
jgi:hypothetical protein